MFRPVEIIVRFFYNVMNFQFGKFYLHSHSRQSGRVCTGLCLYWTVFVLYCVCTRLCLYWTVLPVLWVYFYVSVFLSSCVKTLVFGKCAAVFQVLLLCAEVVHVECLYGAQMLPFVMYEVECSYHVSTVHKIGASLRYRK